MLKRFFSEVRRIERCSLEVPYVNGKVHGSLLRVYDDGKYIIEHWKNGLQHGKEIVMFRGTKLYEVDWVHGVKLGQECFYRKNGSLEQKIVRSVSKGSFIKHESYVYGEDERLITYDRFDVSQID